MGGRGARWSPETGFDPKNWHQLSIPDDSGNMVLQTVAGVKVLQKIDGSTGLPFHSNTPNTMYYGMDKNGQINQLRVFDGRNVKFDIDAPHAGAKGFAAEWHWQPWDSDGNRSRDHFPLSDDMLKKYGRYIDAAKEWNKKNKGKIK